jgi:hypothetical protein
VLGKTDRTKVTGNEIHGLCGPWFARSVPFGRVCARQCALSRTRYRSRTVNTQKCLRSCGHSIFHGRLRQPRNCDVFLATKSTDRMHVFLRMLGLRAACSEAEYSTYGRCSYPTHGQRRNITAQQSSGDVGKWARAVVHCWIAFVSPAVLRAESKFCGAEASSAH